MAEAINIGQALKSTARRGAHGRFAPVERRREYDRPEGPIPEYEMRDIVLEELSEGRFHPVDVQRRVEKILARKDVILKADPSGVADGVFVDRVETILTGWASEGQGSFLAADLIAEMPAKPDPGDGVRACLDFYAKHGALAEEEDGRFAFALDLSNRPHFPLGAAARRWWGWAFGTAEFPGDDEKDPDTETAGERLQRRQHEVLTKRAADFNEKRFRHKQFFDGSADELCALKWRVVQRRTDFKEALSCWGVVLDYIEDAIHEVGKHSRVFTVDDILRAARRPKDEEAAVTGTRIRAALTMFVRMGVLERRSGRSCFAIKKDLKGRPMMPVEDYVARSWPGVYARELDLEWMSKPVPQNILRMPDFCNDLRR